MSRLRTLDDLVGCCVMSVAGVTLWCMEVTESLLQRVPVGNLRVPRPEFAAVWVAGERLCREQGARGGSDWYAAGVVTTCRWLATAIVETQTGRRIPAFAPATSTDARAYEELIEAEFQAAELLDVRQPGLAQRRPGWCEGIRATLHWAWRHDGPPPLPVSAGKVEPGG